MEKKINVKRILNIVINVIFYVFIALVLLFAISTIGKKDQASIANLFGKGYLVVQSDSMAGDNKENFNKRELIIVKLLKDNEKANLKEEDIITFYDVNLKRLNTHRIVGIVKNADGTVVGYVTRGDNSPDLNGDGEPDVDMINVSLENVKAIYNGTHSKVWGGIIGFIANEDNPVGFILCIVLPAVLFLVYTVIMFIKSLMAINVHKAKDDKEAIIAEYEAKLAALQADKEAKEKQEDNSEDTNK